MPKEILTVAGFSGLDIGSVVRVNGKTAVYLGQYHVRTCGCSCVPNCEQLPHITYFDPQSGNIEVMEIRSFDLPKPRKITGISIIHVIAKEHEDYVALEEILKGAGL